MDGKNQIWDERFVALAEHISGWSRDTTKIGCVIVGPDREILTTGYNGFPRGVDDDQLERYEKPAKYQWTEHAERNAIYNASRNGIKLSGSTVFTNWFPCSDCARAIIQSGIKRVVGREPSYQHKKYGADFIVSLQMMTEGGLEITYLEKEAKVDEPQHKAK